MRRLRFIPEGGSLVAVSQRCFQARFLLTPNRRVNKLLAGVVARAQELYGVEIIGLSALSNHLHFLLWVRDAEQLARFMNHVAGNVAREIGRLRGWTGSFWDERYAAVLVDEAEAAQIEQLRYLLAQGCKEDLVARPRDWPGLHAASQILMGRGLEGTWIDRSSLRAGSAQVTKQIQLSRLPCWRHLDQEEYRLRVRDLIRQIEDEASRRRRSAGTGVLGRRAAMRQDPFRRPRAPKRSRLPLVHAVSRVARRRIETAFRAFVAAYRQAAERLRRGARDAVFPAGSFPPPAPFVSMSGSAPPG